MNTIPSSAFVFLGSGPGKACLFGGYTLAEDHGKTSSPDNVANAPVKDEYQQSCNDVDRPYCGSGLSAALHLSGQ